MPSLDAKLPVVGRCPSAAKAQSSLRVTVIVPGRHGALAGPAAATGCKKCTFHPSDRSILPHPGLGDELAAIGVQNRVAASLVPKAGRMPWLQSGDPMPP